MRIIFLPDELTIALCFLLWPLLQVIAALICLKIPDSFYSSRFFLFQIFRFENDGLIYDKIFHVSKWKHLLPDGGVVLNKKGFKKKHLINFSEDTFKQFCIESSRGELTHWLAILPFWIFGFIAPARVIWYMLIYAIFINFPCIVVQRYNRPRVQKLLNRMKCRYKTFNNIN